MSRVMTGVRPACIGMVIGVTLQLAAANYGSAGEALVPSVCVALLDAFLLIKLKIGVPKVICISAALGVLFF